MSVFFRRVVLFLITNLAVVVLIGLVLNLLGVGSWLRLSGTGLNLQTLLVFAAVMGFMGSFISLVLSKTIAKISTGARVIRDPRTSLEIWLLGTVARQARQVGIGMPEVAVYDSPDPNAFATGARRNHALVAVSTGLLESMDRREVEAVLAHEISHVANGDMVTMALLQGVLNTFVIFLARVVGFVVDGMILRSEDDNRPGIGYMAVVVLAETFLGILASLIVAAYSRHREFRADEGAARLEGVSSMISALESLGRVHQPALLPSSLKAFGIRGGGFLRLLSTHPPIEARIENLRRLVR